MLVYRTIAEKVFLEFDSNIMQNLSDILPLFCTPTWPSHHVSENQKLAQTEYFGEHAGQKDRKMRAGGECLSSLSALLLTFQVGLSRQQIYRKCDLFLL